MLSEDIERAITPVDDQRPVLLSNNILDYIGLEDLLQILIN